MTTAAKKEARVDLELLRRFVSELEKSISSAEIAKSSSKEDYLVEMSKATGFATSIMSEATLLIGDIQMLCHMAQGIVSQGVGNGEFQLPDLLKKTLGGTKGPAGSN